MKKGSTKEFLRRVWDCIHKVSELVEDEEGEIVPLPGVCTLEDVLSNHKIEGMDKWYINKVSEHGFVDMNDSNEVKYITATKATLFFIDLYSLILRNICKISSFIFVIINRKKYKTRTKFP